jgi:hypothetical protein
MERKSFTIVIAVLLTIRGIESEGTLSESDGGIVSLQPWHPKDDIVRGGSNVEADGLVVAGDLEEKGVEVGDVPSRRLTAVGQDEGDRMGFRETWKLVALRQLVINKTTLSSTVYQCPSGYSFL